MATMPKGQSLMLRNQFRELWSNTDWQRIEALETAGILIPFQSTNEIKMYSSGMLEFCQIVIEKQLSVDDINEFNIVTGMGVEQTPIIDRQALRRCLLSRNADSAIVETEDALPIGDVVEESAINVPEDQQQIAEENIVSVEDAEEVIRANNSDQTQVRTRAEEPTICAELGLDQEVFAEIFSTMKNNFVYNGVEYGKLSTKAKANLMASGVLPKFKNFRVATEEEINLFLIARSGEYELPENIEEIILERVAARSKKTTGKWRSKKEGTAIPEVVVVETEEVPQTELAAEIEVNEEPIEIAEDEEQTTSLQALKFAVLELVNSCENYAILDRVANILREN